MTTKEKAPLYTLNTLEVFFPIATNYGLGRQCFKIECGSESGFTFTYLDEFDDAYYFQVIATDEKMILFTNPKSKHFKREKEFGYNSAKTWQLKDDFKRWIIEVDMRRRTRKK